MVSSMCKSIRVKPDNEIFYSTFQKFHGFINLKNFPLPWRLIFSCTSPVWRPDNIWDSNLRYRSFFVADLDTYCKKSIYSQLDTIIIINKM